MNRKSAPLISILVCKIIKGSLAFSFTGTSSPDRFFVGTPVKLPRRLVSDCMTRDPLTLSTDTLVDDAMSFLLEHGISGAPVIETTIELDNGAIRSKKIVGVISSTDFLPREDGGVVFTMGGTGASIEEVEGYADSAKKIVGQKVGDIMTDNVITVNETESMRIASNLMSEKKLHRLLVVDDSGALVGILTTSDVMRDVLKFSHLLSPQDENQRDAVK